jgi:hypothetical protein
MIMRLKDEFWINRCEKLYVPAWLIRGATWKCLAQDEYYKGAVSCPSGQRLLRSPNEFESILGCVLESSDF